MEHFYQNIDGWFKGKEPFCKWAVERSSSDSHFIEVGAWLGCSSVYTAVEIINSGKDIKFDVIDTWTSKPEFVGGPYELALHKDIFEIYKKNIEPVKHIINPIRISSVKGSKLYDDESLDFVYIDACHVYNSVLEDIKSWYPKIKKGGVLGGDDYDDVTNDQLNDVARAVNDFFGNNFKRDIHPVCWYNIKPM